MKVSVIIPVYNMANGCVQRCLDSLVQQTVLKRQIADLEIICVDDCSTDNSLEIMKVYEEKFKNTIFVYHLETNRKQGGARNFGFLKSTGDYICYVDADDYVSPEFVEKLLNKAIASNAEVVNCNLCRTHEFSFEYDVKDATDYRFPDSCSDFISRKRHALLNADTVVTKIYKRSFLAKAYEAYSNEFFPSDMFYEDNAAIFPLFLTLKSYETIDDVLYYYWQNPNSTIHTFSWQKMYDRMKAGIILIERARSISDYSLFKDEIDYCFIDKFYRYTFVDIRLQKPSREKLKAFILLSEKMKEYCPHFRENKYYCEKIGNCRKALDFLFQMPRIVYFWYCIIFYLDLLAVKPIKCILKKLGLFDTVKRIVKGKNCDR